jgi:hypothetical protein
MFQIACTYDKPWRENEPLKVEHIQRMQDIAHALAAYFTSPATSAR